MREFTREPILLDGETADDLAAGSARQRAVEAALAELDQGQETPSAEWRRRYSLLLGLERLLSADPIKLADGAELTEHQVDVLSGTLAALTAELEDSVAAESSNGADATAGATQSSVEAAENGADAANGRETIADEDEVLAPDEEPQDWDEPAEELVPEAPEDPGASRRFWFEHATGSGKTVAALGFVEGSRTGGVLILTHRRNLVDQFIGEISDRGYGDRLSPPLLDGADDPYGPVTVETYQWFVRNADRISDAYAIVICDEAHTALGEKTSGCIRRWLGPIYIGMTATGALIARHVADLFPTQTSRFDLAQAARRGVIAPLRCIRIPPGPGVRTIAKVPLRRGEVDQDFDQEELAKLLDQEPFNVAVADLYRSRFRRVPGVVYTAGVRHANNVAASFRAVGMNAQAVSGETPKRELAEILAAFERGEVDVLCNAMLLAEGWNSPRATICMHLAPTASRRVYQQRVGRVTRRAREKEAGLVIDFVHPATTSDETIVTLHSLLDRDVYRGGAIVVGPVRRGPGPASARRAPGGARVGRPGAPPRGAGARAVANRGREPELLRAACVGGARRRPGDRQQLASREGDAPARPGKELRRRFLLTCVQRNRNHQLRLKALAEVAALSDPDAVRRLAGGRRNLAPRRASRGRQGAAPVARRAPHRPARSGPGLGVAPCRDHPRAARGVRGPALAGDEAPAGAVRQLLGTRPRSERAPDRPRRPPAGPPPRDRPAGRLGRPHAGGRGGAPRRQDADGAKALRRRSRAASQLPEVGRQAQKAALEGRTAPKRSSEGGWQGQPTTAPTPRATGSVHAPPSRTPTPPKADPAFRVERRVSGP